MTPRLQRLGVAALLSIVQCTAQASECNLILAPTAPDARFVEQDSGRIIDRRTRLTWARCSVGQSWNGHTCQGTPDSLTYRAAQTYATTHAPWRLPTLQELSGIIELRCFRAAINTRIFPGSASADYWTVTPFSNRAETVWKVNFVLGEAHADPMTTTGHARLLLGP